MMPSRLPIPSKRPKRSPVSSTVTNLVPTSKSGFFLLPRKIRRKIYRYVLLHDIGSWVELPLEPEWPSGPTMRSDIQPNVRLWLEIPEWVDRIERPRPMPPSCPIGILLTSWQTYKEVLPILYHERDFHVRLGGGTKPLDILAIRSHAQLFHGMKNLNISIIWETASSVHITMLFRIFALPVSRCNFRIRVIVLYQSTRFEVEQWFVDAIAGLKAFDNVFFGIYYRLWESNYEWRHYSRLEKGVKHVLGPAVQSSCGLHFRPKDYNKGMSAKLMDQEKRIARQILRE